MYGGVVPVPADAAAVEGDDGVDLVGLHRLQDHLGHQLLPPPHGGVVAEAGVPRSGSSRRKRTLDQTEIRPHS